MQTRTGKWIAWSLMGLVVLLVLASLWLDIVNRHHTLPPGFPTLWSDLLGLLLFVMPFAAVGALIVSRRPGNRIGAIFLIVGVGTALEFLASQYAVHLVLTGLEPGTVGAWAAWLSGWFEPLWVLAFTSLILLFPDGHLPSRRWMPVAALWWLMFAALVAPHFVPGSMAEVTDFDIDNPVGIPALGFLRSYMDVGFHLLIWIVLPGSLVALLVRYRRSGGVERQQMKWITFILVLEIVMLELLEFGVPVPASLQLMGFGALAIAAGIAILKYRLFDIDVIFNKTLVYGALAAFVGAVYVVVAVVIGAFVGATEVLSLVATAIVAVSFKPVEHRAQRLANRVVYGDRAAPYETLSRFSEQVAEVYSTDEVLPRMARILAEGTGASRAEVWLRFGSELRPFASWPQEGASASPVAASSDSIPTIVAESRVEAASRTAQVRDRGEIVGALTVTKPPYEPLTPVEEKLLADLASRAGPVLRNVALIADLRTPR
jgi:hypothetical protein